jgi:hypothetical protein
MEDLLSASPAPILNWISPAYAATGGIPSSAELDPGIRLLARSVAVLSMCFGHWDLDWTLCEPVSHRFNC